MTEKDRASTDEKTGHDVMSIDVLPIFHWCQLLPSVRPNLMRYEKVCSELWPPMPLPFLTPLEWPRITDRSISTLASAAQAKRATTQAENRTPRAPTGVPEVRDQQWPDTVQPPTELVTKVFVNPAAIQLNNPVRT
jgi:hypothetical protein